MRRQLPVYSPLALSAVGGAIAAATVHADAERDRLRMELATRFGAHGVVLLDSGTNALQLALSWASGKGRASGVAALPGYSCYDVVTAAVGAGVRLRFYDVDPLTLTPDLDSVRAVLGEGVSVLVAGNLYGYPLGWEGLASVCDEAGVPIVEDAAQGLGTQTPAGLGGSLGAASILSFGRGKGWTGGGGGALLLRDPRFLVERGTAEAAPNSGGVAAVVTLAAWALGRPHLYRIPASAPGLGLGETHYKEPSTPRGISGFSAALARRTAASAQLAVSQRRGTAGEIMEKIRGVDPKRSRCRPCEPVAGGTSASSASFLRLPVVARDRRVASDLLQRGRALGVASGYPRPLFELEAAQELMAQHVPSADLPGSRELAERLVTLPTHEWLNEKDRARLVELFEPHP